MLRRIADEICARSASVLRDCGVFVFMPGSVPCCGPAAIRADIAICLPISSTT